MKLLLLALAVAQCAAIKDTAADAQAVAFLEKYATEEGAVVKDSGLMYKVLKDGKGGSPGLATPCSCHYEGRIAANYPEGPTFDSSIARGKPSTFAPRQVIKARSRAGIAARARLVSRVSP